MEHGTCYIVQHSMTMGRVSLGQARLSKSLLHPWYSKLLSRIENSRNGMISHPPQAVMLATVNATSRQAQATSILRSRQTLGRQAPEHRVCEKFSYPFPDCKALQGHAGIRKPCPRVKSVSRSNRATNGPLASINCEEKLQDLFSCRRRWYRVSVLLGHSSKTPVVAA
jgi:hypothetical protein